MFKITSLYTSASSFESIEEELMKLPKEERLVDVGSTNIMRGAHKDIADFILRTGTILVNATSKDLDLIESHRIKLMEPEIESYDDFKEMFMKRFSEGTVCILDNSLSKSRRFGDKGLYILMIEGFNGDYVYVRKYFPSKVTPEIFAEHGGYNSNQLYLVESYSIHDIFAKDVFIRYPVNENESSYLSLLFEV